MREHMRHLCDEIWILDLGGEGRGTRKTDNVFAIQTPVAIAVAVRLKKAKRDKPAKVYYARIEGMREAKRITRRQPARNIPLNPPAIRTTFLENAYCGKKNVREVFRINPNTTPPKAFAELNTPRL
jgi:hypothetical protein